MAKTHILAISYDPSLLLTRKLLLEQAGYEVITGEGFVTVSEACQEDFDLAVLGHSIPYKDKEQIIAQLRQNSRAPPFLHFYDRMRHQSEALTSRLKPTRMCCSQPL